MSERPHLKKILIIDDENPVRSVVSAFLKTAQYDVIEAENGSVGLQSAREHLPDLIICDVDMPQMDGYSVLTTLRQDPLTAPIPFIFLTGKGEHTDLRQGMNLGADDYLIKPFRRVDLLRAVETRLAKREAVTRRYATELKNAEEKLNHFMNYDSLTNLPNRLMLREKVNQILLQASPSQQVAILSLGLDRFKRINDTLGHRLGDELLKLVGERLASCISSKDTVARLTADQFAIILSDVGPANGAAEATQAILDRLSAEPFNLEGSGIFTTASAGIALYPQDGNEIDGLVKNAEAARHHAKRKGGNTYEFYSADIQVRSSDELALEVGLCYALEAQQFEVYYQPQIDLRTGKIFGAEALVRWNHPQRGLVSPGLFIPLAEESGLIVPLSEWVLRTSCSQLKKWQEAGFDSLGVAVNLSGSHFGQQNLSDRLIQILGETKLDPSSLDLELTESILMKDVQSALTMLNELKELGIKISIDDFGTGYSSLSYLRRFPFDCLKIDQSFIRNLTADSKNAAITRAIIQMAHTLDLKVLAEGVETISELEFLMNNDCDQMQGYLFSRPIRGADFENLLTSGKNLTVPMP